MSNPNASSGAEHTDASGEGEGSGSTKPKSVSYETHERLLGEKKKLQTQFKEMSDRLKAFEDKQANEERESELAKGNYAKLEKQLKDELEQERARSKSLLDKDIRRAKEAAVIAASKGSLKQKALSLINFDEIALDSEGNPDELSVQKSLKSFKAQWPELIQDSNTSTPPNGAPRGNAKEGLMTYDKWLKLPREEKAKYAPKDLAD